MRIWPVYSATVTLTAADLAVLDTVPFVFLTAQGAGKIVQPVSVSGQPLLNGGILPDSGNASAYYAADPSNQASYQPVSAFKYSLTPFYISSTADLTNSALQLQAGSPIPVPGGIATSAVNDGGIGYVNGDTFTVDGSLGTSATGTITNAVAGVVQAGGYTLDTTPNGYLLATGVTTTATSGVGTGLLLDITALDYSVNPMTLTVQTLYSVMSV